MPNFLFSRGYHAYLRRRDRACRVIYEPTGQVMRVRYCWETVRGIPGLFIEFYGATGIFLLDSEIERVNEFP